MATIDLIVLGQQYSDRRGCYYLLCHFPETNPEADRSIG